MPATRQFHCKDVGYDCEWHLEGSSEEEMLPIIEEHAAKVHNLTHFKDEAVEHVKQAIRDNPAPTA
jgi:predicted small metal-binding protein